MSRWFSSYLGAEQGLDAMLLQQRGYSLLNSVTKEFNDDEMTVDMLMEKSVLCFENGTTSFERIGLQFFNAFYHFDVDFRGSFKRITPLWLPCCQYDRV